MQCEWILKTRKTKLSRKYKGIIGKLEYLNILLKNTQWTSNSPKIIDQNLVIYIDNDYKKYIDYNNLKELYWK